MSVCKKARFTQKIQDCTFISSPKIRSIYDQKTFLKTQTLFVKSCFRFIPLVSAYSPTKIFKNAKNETLL